MTSGYGAWSRIGVVEAGGAPLRSRLTILALAAAGILLPTALSALRTYNLALIVSLFALTGMAFVAAWPGIRSQQKSYIPAVLIAWFVTTPIASFYFRFPMERSFLTFDRMVGLALGALLLLEHVRSSKPDVNTPVDDVHVPIVLTQPRRLVATRFELWWLALTAVVFLSALILSSQPDPAIRTALDAFALPLIVFHSARRFQPSTAGGKWLLIGAIVLALMLLGIGLYEVGTGNNAFAYQGSDIVRAGEVRVNGPFASDSSYSIISALLFIFLLAAPRVFDIRLDSGGRFVYRLSLIAAGIAAMLPFFRATAIAVAISWTLFEVLSIKGRFLQQMGRFFGKATESSMAQDLRYRDDLTRVRRKVTTSLVALCGVTFFLFIAVFWFAPPAVRDRLFSPRNAYGRLATWTFAGKIAYEHPLVGVGLGNYEDFYNQIYTGRKISVELALDTHAAAQPHSNIVWIGTELGVIGLFLYLMANYHLIKVGYMGLRRAADSPSRIAACCFVALFVVYWLPGLELQSGIYSDLNLYFFFLLGLLSGRFSSRTSLLKAAPA